MIHNEIYGLAPHSYQLMYIIVIYRTLLSFLSQIQLSYVANIINETMVEGDVNAFEPLSELTKDRLREYMVGPTWLKPLPFGFSIEIRDVTTAHGGPEKKKQFPAGTNNCG